MKVKAFDIFLCQNRFDLIFKLMYLKNENDYTQKAYLENIRAFNNFNEIEPSDNIPKDSSEKFINSYKTLVKSISNNGYDSTKAPIPIGHNGEIQDGAHRLTVAAYLNIEIDVETDNIHNDFFDYKFFRDRGMKSDIMDYGALEYVKLNPNAYIVNIHSICDRNKDAEVEVILRKYGQIYYQKDINLTYNGYVNIKKISYGSYWEKEPWIGDVSNHFEGAQMHARQSIGKNPLRAYVFICSDISNVIQAKADIRDLFKIGNYSIHINDTREEAICLAQTYFNENSLHMINYRPFMFEDKKFDKKIIHLLSVAKNNKIESDQLCIAGSTPLNIYGVRCSNDIDYLCNNVFSAEDCIISNHIDQIDYYPYSAEEIISNNSLHGYYLGIKFISLEILYKMKLKRREIPKDIEDIEAIARLLKNKKVTQWMVLSTHYIGKIVRSPRTIFIISKNLIYRILHGRF